MYLRRPVGRVTALSAMHTAHFHLPGRWPGLHERYGGIPFELKVRQPNSETVSAMQELVDGRGHKVDSVDAMFADLTEGKVKNVQS